MALLIILIAISAQRFLQILSVPYRLNWATGYYDWMAKKIDYVSKGHGLLGLAILVVPLLLVVSIIFSIVFHIFGIVGYAALSLILLWYYMDARDLVKDPLEDQQTPQQLLQTVYHALFGLVFWYALFGPVGVSLYYIMMLFCQCLSTHDDAQSKEIGVHAQKVLAVLDWVPVRLFTLSFALVGSFSSVFKVWVKHALDGLDPQLQLIQQCAEPIVQEQEDAISLLNRVLVVWLIVIALVTIGQMMSI